MCLMPEATDTVTMDERGRLTVGTDAREKLGVKGKEVIVEVVVKVDEEAV